MNLSDFQWVVECWVRIAVPDQQHNPKLRAARFLEEAMEAAQAAGLSYDDTVSVLNQVYERPKGELGQELGGCLTTLCALATSANLSLEQVSKYELTRMLTPTIIEKVKLRQQYKVNPAYAWESGRLK